MGSEHYCLRWNNHQSNLLGVFSQLLRDESLVDVTLACSEGHSIRAHKVVLSACSSYFQTLFVDHPSRHPIVILKDVRFAELRTLIDFMYKGEVNVEYCQLSALLKTAESLKVKGLAEMTNLGPSAATASASSSSTTTARDYKQETEPEQTEPTELVNKRPSESDRNERDVSPMLLQQSQQQQQQPPPSSSSSSSQQPQPQQQQPLQTHTPPPPRLCRTPAMIDRSSPMETQRSVTPPDECRPSDMSIHNNNSSSAITTASSLGIVIPSTPQQQQQQQQQQSSSCNRIPSPLNNEPLPGPSNMPPVQQMPLSLKKEVDWGGGLGDEKSVGESSSDYARHSHDPTVVDVDHCFVGSPCLDRPSSAHSSRSSTPFALPFPSLATSLLEVGLMHPALLGDEMYRCSSCMAAFPSIWLLEQHTALQHIGSLSTIDKPFVCEQCGQSYRYRSAYVKHREQNHRARLPADKLFSCDVCGMQFRYLKSFKKHRLNHALERLHGKNPEAGANERKSTDNGDEASMKDANENSNNQVSSSNETLTAEESDSDVMTTTTAPTTTTSTSMLIKKETICESESGEANSSDVDKAEAEQDDTIDSMAFTLTAAAAAAAAAGGGTGGASEAFRNAQEASILSFLRADAAERQRERRFACPFCGKCVRSKENLKLHVRKHTGERPFVCLFCGRAFGGKSDLTRHLRIHTGERPYHCDMCGKCFARADYLSKHLTTHINTPR